MREMGFTKTWFNYLANTPKLTEPEFTTFRPPRKDKDWQRGEAVSVVMHPRSPKKRVLGTARIIHKEEKFFCYMPHGLFEERIITEQEAKRDGFPTVHAMYLEMVKMHGGEKAKGRLNKLTLKWLTRDPKYFRKKAVKRVLTK